MLALALDNASVAGVARMQRSAYYSLRECGGSVTMTFRKRDGERVTESMAHQVRSFIFRVRAKTQMLITLVFLAS